MGILERGRGGGAGCVFSAHASCHGGSAQPTCDMTDGHSKLTLFVLVTCRGCHVHIGVGAHVAVNVYARANSCNDSCIQPLLQSTACSKRHI